MAVPFDLGRDRVTGPAVRMLDGVSVMTSGAAEAALSSSGSLVYQTGAGLKQMVLVDLQGVVREVFPERRFFLYPRYSPDGRRIAVNLESQGTMDVWVYDIASHTLSRVTTEGMLNDRPEWNPDGTSIMFRSSRSGQPQMWQQAVDGSGTARAAVEDPQRSAWEGVFTPDGRAIVYRTGSLGTSDIWIRAVTGDTTPHTLVATPFTEWAARPSPDGRWLTYESDETGEFQVYVLPLGRPGSRHQVSVDGGQEPVWSRDGTRIFYRRGDDRLVAVITTTPDIAVVRRDSLFTGDYGTWLGHAAYDVAPDGKHLLLLRPVDDSTRTIVVHNWGAELRARLAAPAAP
jgi:Tol biopolymer transport system component